MAKTLIPIHNQPLRFEDYNEAKFCKKSEPYCYLHQPDDPIRIQFKQIPCSESVLCNGQFVNGDWVGFELMLNGNFTGNANGWTLTTGFAYNANNIQYTSGGFSGGAQQTVPIVAGRTYRLKFSVSSSGGGSLGYALGGTNGTVTGDGNYEIDVVAGSSTSLLSFVAPTGFSGGILDTVSLKEVTQGGQCWSDSGASWSIGDSMACHTPGTSTSLINSTVFTQGKYYKVIWKISGRTEGVAEVQIGGNSDTIRNSNGTFTEYFEGGNTGTALEIIPSTDFDGCIEAIEVYELRKDFTFSLIDLDGNIVANLNYLLVYEKEFINLPFDGINNLYTIVEIFGEPVQVPINLPYGCYKVLVEDECAGYYGYDCGEPSEYISNCIKYAETFSGTYLVIGNNNPTRGIKKWAFGFYFSRHFYLVQRLYIGFRKPKNPDKFDKGMRSSGAHYKNFVELNKVWELIFGAVSEIEHDAINVQINCKEFGFIKNGCEYQYFNITEEYAPEWDAKGHLERAESRIEVMAIGDTLISSQMPSVDDFLLTEDEQALQLEQGGNLEH